MKIQKKYQGTVPENRILDIYNTSNTDTYSCNYINGIVDSGSNSNGDWIKFVDGTMICTKKQHVSVDISTPWGNGLYYGYVNDNVILSQTFISTPVVNITADWDGTTNFATPLGFSEITYNDMIERIALVRGTANSNIVVNLHIIAIGRWK